MTLSHHKRQPNLDTKSLFPTWKRNAGCYMWWLIFFFSGHKIPFPLGNSPGCCRGIFLFPLLLLPRIVFKSSMRYEENCNINTSSGHLYPPLCGGVWGDRKTQGPWRTVCMLWSKYCISCPAYHTKKMQSV